MDWVNTAIVAGTEARPTRKIKAVGRPSLAARQSNFLIQVFSRNLKL